MNCRLMRDMHSKAGITLTEVVLVVAVMGILSGMGVSGFQRAIANARTKDAAYNIAAFMEWTANEARRLSTTLCVKVDPNNRHPYTGRCVQNHIRCDMSCRSHRKHKLCV